VEVDFRWGRFSPRERRERNHYSLPIICSFLFQGRILWERERHLGLEMIVDVFLVWEYDALGAYETMLTQLELLS
jgi:hypothetical protein